RDSGNTRQRLIFDLRPKGWLRHSHESGNPGLRTGETFLPDKFPCRQTWISAFAGMTKFFGHLP
ncbi:TPA: hypothetical protein ACE744_002186, partial [Neisseria gonorrhoeae]